MTSAIKSVHANQPSALEAVRCAIGNSGARRSAARAAAVTWRAARPPSVFAGLTWLPDVPAPAPPFEPPGGIPPDVGTDVLGLSPPRVVGVDPSEPVFGVVAPGVVPRDVPGVVPPVGVVVVGGFVVVGGAVVTVNVCGEYTVVSDGNASLTHVAVTGAGRWWRPAEPRGCRARSPFASATGTPAGGQGGITRRRHRDEVARRVQEPG